METKWTKADIVNEIAQKTKMRNDDVQLIVEEFMKIINRALTKGQNVYLRGFGTFYLKKRAQKNCSQCKSQYPRSSARTLYSCL